MSRYLLIVGSLALAFATPGPSAESSHLLHQIRHIQVDLSKSGSGSIIITHVVPDNVVDELKRANAVVLPDYGMTSEGLSLKGSVRGMTTIKESGKFSDIFCLVRLLDSSNPFSLNARKKFSVEWNGRALTIMLSYARKADAPGGVTNRIGQKSNLRDTTIYISSSHFVVDARSKGHIAEDRRSVVIKASEVGHELVLMFNEK